VGSDDGNHVGKAVVSLVAVAKGGTSLYFSTGGGVIGGGEHDSVRAANRKLLLFVEQGLELFVRRLHVRPPSWRPDKA
jgi:hypothetical protein